MDVPDEPPNDARMDMDAILKLRKKDLIPFAKYHKIDTSLRKEELLQRCKPVLANNPIFHQMLFTLINESLLSVTYDESGESPTLLIRLKEQEDLIGSHLHARWDNDRVMLKDYLDRYLIEAFGIQDSPLEKALLRMRNSVPKELEIKPCQILRFQYLGGQQPRRMV